MRTITLRPFDPGDSLEALTDLLQNAFAPLGAMGLNCTCVDQSPTVTYARISQGECYIAESANQLVGTFTLYAPHPSSHCAWFRQRDVASLHQFAVLPAVQGQGLGSAMLDFSEHWASSRGYRQLALSAAQPATHLMSFYHARGYRLVDTLVLPGKLYASAILSKPLHSDLRDTHYNPCPAIITPGHYPNAL